MKQAKPVGRLAAAISKKLGVDCTAILTVDGQQVCVFFGSQKVAPADGAPIFRLLAKELNRLADQLDQGGLKTTDTVEDSHGITTVLLNPENEKKPDEDPPFKWRMN